MQTTVEAVAATSASASGAKLVDPNTGKEVKMSAGDSNKPASSKPTKGKTSKAGQLVDPNSGEKVEASSVVESKPAAKPTSSKQVKKEHSNDDEAGASTSDKDQPVQINRAPVLTLWVAVVAERQGFSKEAGLTFGKAISAMLAQSKGRCDITLRLCGCGSMSQCWACQLEPMHQSTRQILLVCERHKLTPCFYLAEHNIVYGTVHVH